MGREKVSPTLRSALLRPPKMSRPPAARSAACAKFVRSATLFMSLPSAPRSYTCRAGRPPVMLPSPRPLVSNPEVRVLKEDSSSVLQVTILQPAC